ncbi:MAG: hypothetical protein ORN85_06215 [Sediminibacterium sp.]|nr:hypothetical protein [Sediminibacterium sp.]
MYVCNISCNKLDTIDYEVKSEVNTKKLNQLGEEIKTPFDLKYLQEGLDVLKNHKGSYSDFFTFEDLNSVILKPNMY